MSSSIDNILNNICFIISDLIVLTSSLVTVSVTRIIPTIFEILKWRRGLVIIATAQLHSVKPEFRFCAGSKPARGVSEICDGEDL